MSILKPFALTQLQAHLKTGEICIILSGEEKTRNHDVHYPLEHPVISNIFVHLMKLTARW